MISKGLTKWIVAGVIALSAGTVVAGTVHRVKHSTPTRKPTALVSTSHKTTPAVKRTVTVPKKVTATTPKKTTLAAKPKAPTKLTAKTVKTPTKPTAKTSKPVTKLATHSSTKAAPAKTAISAPKKIYTQPLPLKSSTTPSRDMMPWVY